MTSPESNDDKLSNIYNVRVDGGMGTVIGNDAHVVQHFYDTSPVVQVDIGAAEEVYRQKVVNAYNWLNFSGFDNSDLSLTNVSLEDIFVRLTLTVEKVIQESERLEESSQTKQSKRKRRQIERVIITQQPIELGQALANHLLVVGEPGAGKSTLLRWLAVTFAKGQQQETDRLGTSADPDRLPVLVELGHLPDRYLKPEGGESPNWIQFLPEYLASQMAFSNTPSQLLTQALIDGRCLLLFDGLDEVADRQARTRLARSLVELARLSPGNRVIIGSRPAGVSESEGALRPQFQRCQIERFTLEEVQRFFRFWYALDQNLTFEQQCAASDALYERVQTTPAILQLATTPLLSTVLVLIWRNEGDLPEHRVELYERCCRVLIERWEAYHDVAYQSILADMDWEDHLRLLTPLAYAIHSQEQRTSATRDELIPMLAQALQKTARYANEQVAIWEAKQFLNALSLRSGLLQYMGDGRYGFPHQTFQEYLVARYIAEQPNPQYIDLVMAHLHEAWWQEVHLLTIVHLGSGKVEATKASALILAILHVYPPPSWILLPPRNSFLRWIGPGKLLHEVHLEDRIAWMLDREFELAARSYTECVPNGTTKKVDNALSARAVLIVKHLIYNRNHLQGIIYEGNRYATQDNLLSVVSQLLQHRDNEIVVKVLLSALHDANESIRVRAVVILGQVGAHNEAIVNALLKALYDTSWLVSRQAAITLGQVGMGNETVVKALLKALYDTNMDTLEQVVVSLGQVGMGNETVVKALLEALYNTNMSTRQQIVVSLEQVGAGNETVIKALLDTLLNDKDKNVREQVAISLGQVGMGSETVIKALLDTLLNDKNGYVCEQAAISLGRIGADNKTVMEVLLEDHLETLLKDEDVGHRWHAAKRLGEIGAGNETVVKALLNTLLNDKDEKVRREAARSLGRVGVGNETLAEVLLETLHHEPDEYVRGEVAESLGQIGVSNTVVVKALLESLDHDADEYVRLQVAASLGKLGIRDTTQLRPVLVALNRRLYDEYDSVGHAALVSIRHLLNGQPIPGYKWRSLRERWVQHRLKQIEFWFVMLAIVVFMLAIDLAVSRWLHIHNWTGLLIGPVGTVCCIAALANDYNDRIQHKLQPYYPKSIIFGLLVGVASPLVSWWLKIANWNGLQTGFLIILATIAIFISNAFIATIYRYWNQGKRAKVMPRRQSFRAIREQQLELPQLDTAIDKWGEQYYRGILAISEQMLGTDHLSTATRLNDMALLYYNQKEYEQAEQLLKRALAIREQALGPEHPETETSLNTLVALYLDQKKYEQAELLSEHTLTISEQLLGPLHSSTMSKRDTLIGLYWMQEKYSKVEALYQYSIAICEQRLGTDHLNTATSLKALAVFYYDRKKYEQAEPLLKRALTIQEQVLGPEHPDTETNLYTLIALYLDQKKYEQAELLWEHALTIREQFLGADHPDIVPILNNLAYLYESQGKYEEAGLLYQRVLQFRERELGSEHPDTAVSLNDLALLYIRLDRYVEAEQMLKRALAIYEQVLGLEHPQTQDVRQNYVLLLQTQGHNMQVGKLSEGT